MSLTPPVLDDRKFQQIVDEVRKRIPLYCPEWTDHNLSDPGITMIELFAWMVEMLLYRLNRVPELHYIKFMEFLGYQRRSPSAAQTRVTFWLTKLLTQKSDPDNQGLTIDGGTEVATTQTETKLPIIFTTHEKFPIHAPILKALVIGRQENGKEVQRAVRPDEFLRLRDGLGGMEMFSKEPQVDESVYFGFDNAKHDLHYHILSLKLDFEIKSGVGVNPAHPPYVWEAYTPEDTWQTLIRTAVVDAQNKPLTAIGEVDDDTTLALNVSGGEVVLLLPELGKVILAGVSEKLHWVRVRIKRPSAQEKEQGMRPYGETPYLRQIVQVAAVGASVRALHARVAMKEFFGESDGTPGQRFQLDAKPLLLPLAPNEVVRVKVNADDNDGDGDGDGDEDVWSYTPNFAASNANSRHFTLDSLSGEVRFGPAVRQPNGEIKQYGKTPMRGTRLCFEQYRYGGGVEGNVARRALNVLKSSIPYVDRVENRLPAVGGIDGQTVDAAQLEVQRLIQTRQLAITPDDYVARVLDQFAGKIARVQCLPLTTNQKATMRLYVLPVLPDNGTENGNRYVTNAELHVPETVRQAIDNFLEHIRMLTVQARSENFTYLRVGVVARVRKKTGASPPKVRSAIVTRLNELLHPITGGPHGQGWPFAATITHAVIQQAIEKLSGVETVEALELQQVEDIGAGKRAEQYSAQERKLLGAEIKLEAGQMVVAGYHAVTVIE